MNLNKTHIKKTFTVQHGEFSCGIACLESLVKYYGGETNQEKLKTLSGTTIYYGTTLLGLYQAAQEIGFDADGFKTDIENLQKIGEPVILHIIKNKLNHFVICYAFDKNGFYIGDPSGEIRYYTQEEFVSVWQTQTLLKLVPNNKFITQKTENKKKWNYFKKLISPDNSVLITATVLGFVTSVLGLSMSVFSQQLIDDLLPNGNQKKIVLGICLLFVILIIKSLAENLRIQFLARQSRDFNNRMVNRFFSTILLLPMSFFDSCKTGELVARLNDTRRIQGVISYLSSSAAIDFLNVLVSIMYIFILSWMSGIIAVFCIPLFIILVFTYSNQISDKQRNTMAAYAATENNFIDTMQGISVIKTMNKETLFQKITFKIYDTFQIQSYRLSIFGAKYNLKSTLAAVFIITSIIALSVYQVLNKQLKIGELTAIITMSSTFVFSIANLSVTNIRLREAKVAFDRIFEISQSDIENDEKIKNKVTNDKNENFELEVSKLNFRFAGRSLLLQDIDFKVKTGEMITLFGEIGSGKSTVLKLLQRFYKPESENITVNSEDINIFSTSDLRNKIGYVPQNTILFNGTVVDNILLNDNQSDYPKAIEFCKEAGFHYFFEQFPQNYLTIIGENGSNLSGGQRQLIALARVLYHKPQLLLLDEPTSAMDRKTEHFVFSLLNKLKTTAAIIIVTHRVEIARFSDRIYVIEKGKISVSGSHVDLIKSNNIYCSIHNDLLGIKIN